MIYKAIKCPRQELNLHPTCVGRDFKSLASTSSATRAKTKNSTVGGIFYYFPPGVYPFGMSERKTRLEPATSTLARLRSTNWATSASTNYLKKRTICFLSESLAFTPCDVYFRGCKNRERRHRRKIFFELFVLGRVQGVPGHVDLRFAFVTMCVQTITAADRQCDNA